jgi:hypothetical protein
MVFHLITEKKMLTYEWITFTPRPFYVMETWKMA